MATRSSAGRWEKLRAKRMDSPAFRERYERTRQSLDEVQAMLAYLDEQRESAGLSKADLARKIGAHPAVIRRLFSNGTSNPTLKTVVDVMNALGLQMRFSEREAAWGTVSGVGGQSRGSFHPG